MIKEGLRERIRAERRRRGPMHRHSAAHDLAAVALEVPEITSATCVAAYASVPAAPGTLPLRRALHRSGVRVLLPALTEGGRPDWYEDRAASPRPDIGTRLGSDALRTAQAVIVPALAVDTLGHRLGQGGGFYDRALTQVGPSVPVFAVVFDGEILDAAIEPVPVEAHDQPVDAIITPHRCLRLLPGRRAG